MILIIGGAGQGKLDYVLSKTGFGEADVARDPEAAKKKPVFAGVEHWPDLDEESLLAANPDVILICREVGCGVVPVDCVHAYGPNGLGVLPCLFSLCMAVLGSFRVA